MDAVLRNFKNIPCPRGERCSQPGCQWFHRWDDSVKGAHGKGRENGFKDTQIKQDEASPKKQRTSVSPPSLKRKAAESLGDQRSVKKCIATEPAGAHLKKQALSKGEHFTSEHGIHSTTSSLANASPGNRNVGATTPSSKIGVRPTPGGQETVKTRMPTESKCVPIKAATSSPTPTPAKKSLELGNTPSQSKTSTPKSVTSSSPIKNNKSGAPLQSDTGLDKATKPSRKPETLNPRHLKASPATHEFRLKALKMLHDQYVRLNNELKKQTDDKHKELILTDQELIWKALDDEQSMAIKKGAVYGGSIKHLIMGHKKMDLPKWIAERQEAISTADTTKAGTDQPVFIDTGLSQAQELELLREHLLTPVTNLAKFGYVPEVPSEEDIAKAKDGEEAAKGWERCDRCTTRFQVFPGRREEDGALTSGGKCTYHYGKVYYLERDPTDKGVQNLRRLSCCKEAIGDSVGCVEAETHVFKTSDPKRLAAVLPFAATPPNSNVPEDRAVAMDCEMCYTARGFELIRLTVTNWPDGKELLDVLVHPVGEILDLNSRWSGVWPEDFANAEPWTIDSMAAASASSIDSKNPGNPPPKKKLQMVSSPIVARDLLFSLIAPDTPIIGHGLENDLNSVRVVHPTIVDTVLLFPHSRGLPIRNSLKALMKTHLNKLIQVEAADGKQPVGHDSAEDARAAGDLVRWKIKDKWAKMKMNGWRLEGGYFVDPKKKTTGRLSEGYLEYS